MFHLFTEVRTGNLNLFYGLGVWNVFILWTALAFTYLVNILCYL